MLKFERKQKMVLVITTSLLIILLLTPIFDRQNLEDDDIITTYNPIAIQEASLPSGQSEQSDQDYLQGEVSFQYVLPGEIDHNSSQTPTDIGQSIVTKQAQQTNPSSITVEKNPEVENKILHKVLDVVDGDTIKVDINGKMEVVRLVGLDTPELSSNDCYAQEAKDYLVERVKGQMVELVQDQTQGDRDRFGRLLRYLYLDQELINQTMIEKGLGYAFTDYGAEKIDQFIVYQQIAQNQRVGLWGNCN